MPISRVFKSSRFGGFMGILAVCQGKTAKKAGALSKEGMFAPSTGCVSSILKQRGTTWCPSKWSSFVFFSFMKLPDRLLPSENLISAAQELNQLADFAIQSH